MKQKRPRKRGNFSEEEKEQMVRRYEESGLSQAVFCRREEVGLSNLRRWIGKSPLKRGEGKNGGVRFVEVEATEQVLEKNHRYRLGNRRELWVEFGNGFDGVEVLALASILREAERC